MSLLDLISKIRSGHNKEKHTYHYYDQRCYIIIYVQIMSSCFQGKSLLSKIFKKPVNTKE